MIFDISIFKALVKGEYSTRPCVECENGLLYIDGEYGDVLTIKTYREYEEKGHEHLYTEECDVCYGIGKRVIFDDETEII